MSARQLALTFQDAAFAPDDGDRKRIYVTRAQGGATALYRVFLYLDGPDLPFVDRVLYTLHETFEPRVREVRRTIDNGSCRLEIWTWGTFEASAEVFCKDGRHGRLSHALRWDEDLKAPGVTFVSGSPANGFERSK